MLGDCEEHQAHDRVDLLICAFQLPGRVAITKELGLCVSGKYDNARKGKRGDNVEKTIYAQVISEWDFLMPC